MVDTPSSPPKGLTHSPSIFAYQTRILNRTSSVRNGGPSLAHLASDKSSSNLAFGSPPNTPIRKTVSNMVANNEFQNEGKTPVGLGIGRTGVENRAGGAVNAARSQWESKISDAAAMDKPASPVLRSKRSIAFAPLAQNTNTPTSPPIRSPSNFNKPSAMASDVFGDVVKTPSKRSMESPTSVIDAKVSTVPSAVSSSADTPTSAKSPPALDSTPAPISSLPSTTRSQAVEDTLAQARANALKRLEARRKAKGESTTTDPTPVEAVKPAETKPVLAAAPVQVSAPAPLPSASPLAQPSVANDFPKTPSSSSLPRKAEPLTAPAKPEEPVPVTSSRPAAPPSSLPYRGLPSTLRKPGSVSIPNAFNGPSAPAPGIGAGRPRVISGNDGRRLGRHLPRIVSGEGGWAEGGSPRGPSRRIPSTLGRPDSVVLPSSLGETGSSPRTSKRPEPLSLSNETPAQSASVPATPATPSTKRRSYLLHTPKEGLASPREEVAGEEMKGLMSAIGATPSLPGAHDDVEAVTGMTSRLRLSRSTLPPSASSKDMAPTPLPSRRLVQNNWMDRQRHQLASYEYLCHVGEALQWVEGCIDEETGFGVTEMDDGLRDGVVLAKLARAFQGPQVVKKIWTVSQHGWPLVL